MTSMQEDIIGIFREDCKYWPRIVSYDDWSDVYHIIEFEKESDSPTKPSHQDDNSNNTNGCVGCILLILLYSLIIGGFIWLWSGVDATSVFDGWQPDYP